MNVTIFFKSSMSTEVKNLTAIEFFNSRGRHTLSGEHMETVILNPHCAYVFIGEKESVAVFGADLLYVRFVKS